MAENKAKTSSLDALVEKVGGIDKQKRIIIAVVIVVLIVGLFGWFVLKPLYEEIGVKEEEKHQAIAKMEDAKKRAAKKKTFEAEIKKVQADFDIAKKALPESEEIPSLLTSISEAGQDAGLTFLLLKPDKEVSQGFYAELPINIKVTGSYRDLALFFFRVSKLARIVNIRDIEIIREFEQARNDPTLQIACQALTYKFIEQVDEENEEE